MKLDSLIFVGMLLLPTAWAQNESGDGQLEKSLVSIVTATTESRFEALNKAIRDLPLDTQQFVSTGLEAGYPLQDVLDQCKAGIGDDPIKVLIRTLIQDGADMERIMAACLPYVTPMALADIMVMLFQEVSPVMLESTAQLALDILAESDVDARAILVSSLAESGVLSVDGYECGPSCLSAFADNLLQTPAGVDGVIENGVQEPALSGS